MTLGRTLTKQMSHVTNFSFSDWTISAYAKSKSTLEFSIQDRVVSVLLCVSQKCLVVSENLVDLSTVAFNDFAIDDILGQRKHFIFGES